MNTNNELTRQILNLARKGRILAVDHQGALCRVVSGELETNWIPWLVFAAGTTRDWLPPTVNEQVLLICAGGDPAEGVALRGIYSQHGAAPGNKASAHIRVYPDGAVIEYDHEQHALRATLPEGGTVNLIAPGSVTIKTGAATVEADTVLVKADTVTVEADNVKIDAPNTTCTGNLVVQQRLTYMGGMIGKPGAGGGSAASIEGHVNVTGNVTSTGDVKAGDISLTGHSHMEQGDGKKVGPPL